MAKSDKEMADVILSLRQLLAKISKLPLYRILAIIPDPDVAAVNITILPPTDGLKKKRQDSNATIPQIPTSEAVMKLLASNGPSALAAYNLDAYNTSGLNLDSMITSDLIWAFVSNGIGTTHLC